MVAPSSLCSRAISTRICTRSSASRLRERLVEQEHLRLAHDGAADRDALALAAGKLPRLALQQLGSMRRMSAAALDPPGDVGLGVAGHAQAEAQILLDRHVRIERIGLEHHGDAALGRLDIVDDLAADRDLAVGDVLEPGDHPQQRRLSAARRADEDHELAVGDLEVGAVDDLVGAEALDDFLQGNASHACLPIT